MITSAWSPVTHTGSDSRADRDTRKHTRQNAQRETDQRSSIDFHNETSLFKKKRQEGGILGERAAIIDLLGGRKA